MRFSSHEKIIITSCVDGKMNSWKMKINNFNKNKLFVHHTYKEHKDGVNYITITKDGKSFISCSVNYYYYYYYYYLLLFIIIIIIIIIIINYY